MRTPLLDSQISRALVQPTPWEIAQWRAAALKDKAAWSALIDIGSSHRFCDDVQRSVDTEIRRERMWCGPAPCVAAAAPVPTELSRNEFYQARNLFSWRRDDARVEAAGQVTTFGDKVALVSEGAVQANARSVDPAHAFSQASSPKQLAAPSASASFNGQLACVWTGAQEYISSIAATNWKAFHSAGAWAIWSPFVVTNGSTRRVICASSTGSTPGAILYGYITGTMNAQVLKAAGVSAGFQVSAGAVTVNTPAYAELSDTSAGACSLFKDNGSVASGTISSATTADPGQSMTIGSNGGLTWPFVGSMPEHLFATQNTTTLRTAVYRYFLLRYAR